MKAIFAFFTLFLLVASSVTAQKHFTKTGTIRFDATSPSSPEKIEAINRTATCVLDAGTGALQFAVLMKGFSFERALMEEHFNENYVESHKFPKSEFRGSIVNPSAVNFSRDGSYAVTVKGKLTLHGITLDVETAGQVNVKGGKISAAATFPVTLADYGISIPGVVADKVAKTARISVDVSLEPLKAN